MATLGPGVMLLWEKIAPSYVGKGGFASIMRLSGTIGAGFGFLWFYTCSIRMFHKMWSQLGFRLKRRTDRFYGIAENKREVEMDMREMVNKVKKHEPLYGVSTLTPYMQGVAARNSRYSGIWLHVVPWFNFVNHDQVFFQASGYIEAGMLTNAHQHGVDTAKYYRQAETELAAVDAEKGKI